MTAQTFVACARDRHARAILDVFNEAIETSTALFDAVPRPPASMEPRFAALDAPSPPVDG